MVDFRALEQQPALQALGWTLLHFLWQGAALGFVAFILLHAARPTRASTRYAIAVATLALMLASFTVTFITLSRTATSLQTRVTPSVMPASSTQGSMVTGLLIADFKASPTAQSLFIPPRQDAAPSRPQPLGPVPLFSIVAAWSLGVLILSFRLVGGWMLARRLARRAIDTVSPALDASARAIAERLRLRRGVAILESTAVAVPTLVGWVKPVVLFPASALAGLSPEQLQAILAHELAHVRRHDYLINLLQSVIETLLFYHPAVWWVSAQVREEREHCCDDLAVEVCGDRLLYVSALAELMTITAHRGFALAATDGSLLGRVRRILGSQRPTYETPPVWTALAMLVLVVGSAGAFGASNHEPTRAGDIELQPSMTANQVLPPPPAPPPIVPSPFDLPPVPPDPPTPPLAPESSLPPLPPEPPSPPALPFSWILPPAAPAAPAPPTWPVPATPPPAAPAPPAWSAPATPPPVAPALPSWPAPVTSPPAPPTPPAWPAPAPPQRVRDPEPPPPPPEPPAVATLATRTTRGGATSCNSAVFIDLVRAMPSS
jgi:bla regulator protein blaR1